MPDFATDKSANFYTKCISNSTTNHSTIRVSNINTNNDGIFNADWHTFDSAIHSTIQCTHYCSHKPTFHKSVVSSDYISFDAAQRATNLTTNIAAYHQPFQSTISGAFSSTDNQTFCATFQSSHDQSNAVT